MHFESIAVLQKHTFTGQGEILIACLKAHKAWPPNWIAAALHGFKNSLPFIQFCQPNSQYIEKNIKIKILKNQIT